MVVIKYQTGIAIVFVLFSIHNSKTYCENSAGNNTALTFKIKNEYWGELLTREVEVEVVGIGIIFLMFPILTIKENKELPLHMCQTKYCKNT